MSSPSVCGGPKRSLRLPHLLGDRSRPVPGDFLWSSCLLGLRPRRLSVAPFSLRAEELSFFDMRASSPFIYFSALARTSAMLA